VLWCFFPFSPFVKGNRFLTFLKKTRPPPLHGNTGTRPPFPFSVNDSLSFFLMQVFLFFFMHVLDGFFFPFFPVARRLKMWPFFLLFPSRNLFSPGEKEFHFSFVERTLCVGSRLPCLSLLGPRELPRFPPPPVGPTDSLFSPPSKLIRGSLPFFSKPEIESVGHTGFFSPFPLFRGMRGQDEPSPPFFLRAPRPKRGSKHPAPFFPPPFFWFFLEPCRCSKLVGRGSFLFFFFSHTRKDIRLFFSSGFADDFISGVGTVSFLPFSLKASLPFFLSFSFFGTSKRQWERTSFLPSHCNLR